MQIYLDNAATTALDPEALKSMTPYLAEEYGNPASQHTKGKNALMATDRVRKSTAQILNCRESEIIFTSGGTESNNLAILGFARANKDRGRHIVSTEIEHSSILEPLNQLKNEGFQITLLKPDKEGFISPDDVKKAITKDTILVSIIYANNEIGTIQPIKEIGQICREHKVPFHTDACQAATTLSLDTKELRADLLTINGSKIYGPKGIGALYKNREITLQPIISGGSQERGIRGGTLNVPGIVGFARALEIAQQTKEEQSSHQTTLRDKFLSLLQEKNPQISLNGSLKNRLANNLNIQIPQINTQLLLLHLDNAGIYCSTGSACHAGSTSPSHVLSAIGLSEQQALSSLRLSLGKHTTEKEIIYAAEKIIEITEKMK